MTGIILDEVGDVKDRATVFGVFDVFRLVL